MGFERVKVDRNVYRTVRQTLKKHACSGVPKTVEIAAEREFLSFPKVWENGDFTLKTAEIPTVLGAMSPTFWKRTFAFPPF